MGNLVRWRFWSIRVDSEGVVVGRVCGCEVCTLEELETYVGRRMPDVANGPTQEALEQQQGSHALFVHCYIARVGAGLLFRLGGYTVLIRGIGVQVCHRVAARAGVPSRCCARGCAIDYAHGVWCN